MDTYCTALPSGSLLPCRRPAHRWSHPAAPNAHFLASRRKMSEKRTASALAPMEGDDAVDDGAESSLAGDASATKPTPTDLNVVLQVSGSPPSAQEMYTQTASDAAEDPNSPLLTPERSPSFNPVAKEDGIAVDKQKHPARTENMQLSDVVAVGAGSGSGAAGSSASGPSFVSRWSSAPARAGG